ncbi:MAG: hypothetical protein AB1716_00985 [Planctomycetota bacterium]
MPTYYHVAPDGNDGSPDPTNPATPWATLQMAVDSCGAGTHLIKVKTGTFNLATLLSCNNANLWTKLTFIGCDAAWNPVTDPANGPLLNASSTDYCIRQLGAQGKTLELQGLRIVGVPSTKGLIQWGGTNTTGDAHLTVSKCTLKGAGGSGGYIFKQEDGSYAYLNPTRVIKFIDCTIDANNGSAALFRIGSSHHFELNGVTLQNAANAGLVSIYTSWSAGIKIGVFRLINVTGALGTNLMNVPWSSSVAQDWQVAEWTIKGCTLTGTGLGFKFHPIGNSLATNVTIHDNEITLTSNASWNDIIVVGLGDTAGGALTAQYGQVSILRNKLKGIGATVPTNVSHGLGVMRGCVRGEVAYNHVHFVTRAQTYAGVIKGDGLAVHHNTFVGTYPLLLTHGHNNAVRHNSCYCNYAGGRALTLNRNIDNTSFAEWNIITDNIFDGGLAGVGGYTVEIVHYTSGTVDTVGYKNNLLDRNLLVRGTAEHLATINGVDCDSVAGMCTAWANYTGARADNDAATVEADPKCLDPANGDFRIPLNSPAVVYGTQNIALGAWGAPLTGQTLYHPPARFAMNYQALPALTATGSDQAVDVPRGHTLIVHPIGASCEVRHVAAGDKLTIPADTLVFLGESLGQTVYLRAQAGTTIELALT